jgi:uncharacterized protein YkwD
MTKGAIPVAAAFARFGELRRAKAALLLAAWIALPVGVRAQAGDVIDPTRVVELTNRSRADARLAPLAVSPRLTAAAEAKLDDMLARRYFEHRTPDGRQPWWFIREAGYRIHHAAENLAKGYFTETDLQRDWMRSRGHRANILGKNFTEIGVASRHDLVVVMFGRPMD